MGINVNATISLTFLLGGALAGAAGLVYAVYETNIWYFQGFQAGPARVHRRGHGRHRQRPRRGARRPDHRRHPVAVGLSGSARSGPRRSCSATSSRSWCCGPPGCSARRRGRRGERSSRPQLRRMAAAPPSGCPPWWSRALAVALVAFGVVLPFLTGRASGFMNGTIIAIAYAVMSLGLNIVVGMAGLLDLGYVAFYALGAYSRRLVRLGVLLQAARPRAASRRSMSALPGIHLNFLLILVAAVVVCAVAGMIIGLPTLRLRGDYIAIVTLAFGEIIGVVAVNGQSISLGGGHDADRGQPRHPRGRRAVLPRLGTFSQLDLRPWYWLIFGILLDRALRQPAGPRLAARPGLGRAARGRGRGRLDGHPAGARPSCSPTRSARRSAGCPGRSSAPTTPWSTPASSVRVLDLHPRHGDHRRARLDLGRPGRAACCSATSTTG